MKKPLLFLLFLTLMGILFPSCSASEKGSASSAPPFDWKNANVYFLLTDRFYNGDPSNDINFERKLECGPMRDFQGGDLAGVLKKLEEGYFEDLGITALWLTPWFEQIHGQTDEGTGPTYGYHGYWTRDWTAVDPNFGTPEELAQLVDAAHDRGIRVVMDVIINHTGPVTESDPVWPAGWVRTGPACTYQDYQTTVTCTLVENLPDVRTESDESVDLPPFLLDKWEKEGRLEKELEELEDFFERTGYPRSPRYYIIKWLCDYIRKYGIDGFRLDTAKHVEEGVWKELFREASAAFDDWKRAHPGQVLDTSSFFMVGEVYGYGIGAGREYNFGDRRVDYFSQSIHSLINMGFKEDAKQSYESLFSSYSEYLQGVLKGQGVLNYLTSHDDHHPFDKERTRTLEAGTKLLLAPGAAQVYYGDESARNLNQEGAAGDATLRGPMNWDEIGSGKEVQGIPVPEVLEHYQKLGTFRKNHPAVGAGVHQMISREPYVFSRTYASGTYSDLVVVGLDLDEGEKTLPVSGLFPDGTRLYDSYSRQWATVDGGTITLESPWGIVLLGLD
jgi:alpha-amylase